MDPEWILSKITAKADVQDYLISQEQHKDGGYHIHAYFKFAKKLDKRDPKFFDVVYYKKPYHPNIQKPKYKFKLFDYIKKDKKFITNISETRPPWLVLLEDYDDDQEFLIQLMWLQKGNLTNGATYNTLRELRLHMQGQADTAQEKARKKYNYWRNQ